MGIGYRILPAEEYEKLAAFNERNSLPAPVPELSLVAVLEVNGEIKGRWDILLQAHLDNGCIDEDYRGRFVNFRRWYKLLEDRIASVIHGPTKIYSTSVIPNALGILKILGFKETSPQYDKVVEPK